MGIAKANNIPREEKMCFVRKIMHTNFAGEISDNFCADGDRVYKEIFLSRQFSNEEVDKMIQKSIESPSYNKAETLKSKGKNIKEKKSK